MNETGITYGTVVVTSLPFDRAVERARQLLQDEGFGVLSEIDVAKTLKEKRGIEFQPYVILGACNPDFASQALMVEAQIGLLLPCNVVVTVDGGKTKVSAVDAAAMLGIVGKPDLADIAVEVNRRLRRVLAGIAAE
jgi:uncharacterized protein (DUF302 family)